MLAKKLLLITLIILVSCNDNNIEVPIASTQAKFKLVVGNNGIAPSNVTLINQSVNATDYTWDFGDGTIEYTNTLDTICHNFIEPRTYHITLTVGSRNPDLHYNSLIYKRSIVINPTPVKRLYFTDRVDGKVKYVILNDSPFPILEEFESASLDKPYGMVIDKANGTVYVTDYSKQLVNLYGWRGTNHQVILNTNNSTLNSPIGIEVVGSKIFWCQPGGIYSANLDGSSPHLFLSIPGEYPQDIAFDNLNQVFYFTNNLEPQSGGVWKVNANGTGLQLLIPNVWGAAIEVDPDNERLYYYVGYEGMYISDLLGNNITLFDSSNAGKWTWGMAIDKDDGKVYYPNRVDMTIMRANLDGTNVEIFIPATASINPNAMAIDGYR